MSIDVVILAAGLGRRLGAQANVVPKCLVQVGDTPLLVRSLALLRSHGFNNVIVVTGHLSHLVKSAVHAHGFSSFVRFVENDVYRESSTARSLCFAFPNVSTDTFLLLEGDLLFSSQFLVEARRRLAAPTVFTASRSGSGDEVHVVTTTGGRPLEITKNISELGQRAVASGAARVCGELAGISILPRSFLSYLQASRGEASFEQRDYESFIVGFSTRTAIEVCLLQDVPWTEVDNPADLHRARTVVWPQLVHEGEVAMKSKRESVQ